MTPANTPMLHRWKIADESTRLQWAKTLRSSRSHLCAVAYSRVDSPKTRYALAGLFGVSVDILYPTYADGHHAESAKTTETNATPSSSLAGAA